jgi:hypothetical protein
MSNIDSSILCPSCKGQLQPKVLVCESCDLRVEGPFEFNEFASLSPDDLHFLRIFVRCEGRVRDMEPALGLSYPTIRTRLTELKNKLNQSKDKTQEILALLEQGKISFEDAMARIKRSDKGK